MSLMIDSKTLGVEATEQAASRLPVEQPPPRPVRTRRGRVGSMVKVSMITGVGCVGALFAAEHLGPPEWKPLHDDLVPLEARRKPPRFWRVWKLPAP